MSKKSHKKEASSVQVESQPFTHHIGLYSIGILQVVCPLLFFTNLTRNPYFTQIALLNIFISVCIFVWAIGTFRSGIWKIPRVSFEWPLLIFLLIAFMTTILSWLHHPGLRIGIRSEAIRIWTFTLINSVAVFYLPLLYTKPLRNVKKQISIWTDIILALLWGACWLNFRSPAAPTYPSLIWDPYGGFLWILALVYVVFRVRRGEALAIFHMICVVALLAGLYGLIQYAGRDIIWSSPIKPYGGRPVSSFGNPNFLSSYLMLVSCLALSLGFASRGKQAVGYYLVATITILSTLGTLTRSTYVGLFAGLICLGFLLYRKEHFTTLKWTAIGVGALLLLLLLFPKTPVTGTQSPLARFVEIYEVIQTGHAYAPWHQRIMIWSSAWDMVRERFFFGKGWGCFELFYPFYQGKYTLIPLFAQFRTHANNAHNILMEVWSQVGILGTGTAIWFMITLFAGGLSIYRKKPEGFGRVVTAGLLSCFVAMMFDNFFGNVSIFFAVPAFLFWWMMGALYNESDQNVFAEMPVTKGLGWLGLLLLMGLSIASTTYFVKRWNQEFYYFKGFKEAKKGLVEQSVKSLEKAFSWFPWEVNSNYEMGNSYARFAQVLADRKLNREALAYKKKAAEAYQAALYANPGYDEIYFNLGVTYNQVGERDKAIRNIQTALFINPLLRDGYASLGNIYVTGKELEKAVDIFETGLLSFPRDKEIWLNLGFVYGQLYERDKKGEQGEKAHAAFRKAYQIDPNFQEAYQNLKLISSKLGIDEPLLKMPALIRQIEEKVKRKEFESAIPLAREAVEYLPEDYNARLTLGNLLYYGGRTEEALAVIQEALELNPQFAAAYLNLGEIYKAKGNNELAQLNLEKCLTYEPQNQRAKTLLESLPQQ